MYAVRWTDTAASDYEAIIDYLIAEANPYTAARYAEGITSTINGTLAHMPEICRVWRLDESVRCCSTVSPYLIIYSIDHTEKAITVLSIFHGRRLAPI